MLLESQPQGPGVAKPGCHALLTDPLALELGGALAREEQEVPASLPSGPSCHQGDMATLPPTQRKASARQATVPLVRLEAGGQGMAIPGRWPGWTHGGWRGPAPPAHLCSTSGSDRRHRGSARGSLLCFFLLPVGVPRGRCRAAPRPLWHWPNCHLLSKMPLGPAHPPSRTADRSPKAQSRGV